MNEAEKDLVFRVYKAIYSSEKKAKKEVNKMMDEEIEKTYDRICKLFMELVNENDYVQREDFLAEIGEKKKYIDY